MISRNVLLAIEDKAYALEKPPRQPLSINEDEALQLSIELLPDEELPAVFFEDTQVSWLVCEKHPYHYQTATARHFSESFGYASVRIEFATGTFVIPFDVMARKNSAEQARKMISYLASHSEYLIKCCFAQTVIGTINELDDYTDPETLLVEAEAFVDLLQSFRAELLHNLRERLIPVQVPFWEASRFNCEIDPYEILNNLDALTPSFGSGDVFIQGRHFDLSCIDVSSLKSTANVLENQILLGGLYSIRQKIGDLLEKLEQHTRNNASTDSYHRYESFDRLLLSLTAEGMARRCRAVIQVNIDLIKLFEHRLHVKFIGEVSPVMTPYARSSRVYRTLFTQLSQWHELGQPSLDGIHFLMKLKSLSKIYELFVFFQLLAVLREQSWQVIRAKPHDTMGEYLPAQIVMVRDELQLTVDYEPKIIPWTAATNHYDLIDVAHSNSAFYSYWQPDFTLKLEHNNRVSYVILDAKYSSAHTVRHKHLPRLFEKYFLGVAVYDEKRNLANNTNIAGVIAVYSLDADANPYLSYWHGQGINSRLPRLPMVGGIGLMTENTYVFKDSINKIIELMSKTLYIYD